MAWWWRWWLLCVWKIIWQRCSRRSIRGFVFLLLRDDFSVRIEWWHGVVSVDWRSNKKGFDSRSCWHLLSITVVIGVDNVAVVVDIVCNTRSSTKESRMSQVSHCEEVVRSEEARVEVDTLVGYRSRRSIFDCLLIHSCIRIRLLSSFESSLKSRVSSVRIGSSSDYFVILVQMQDNDYNLLGVNRSHSSSLSLEIHWPEASLVVVVPFSSVIRSNLLLLLNLLLLNISITSLCWQSLLSSQGSLVLIEGIPVSSLKESTRTSVPFVVIIIKWRRMEFSVPSIVTVLALVKRHHNSVSIEFLENLRRNLNHDWPSRSECH